MKSPVQKSQDEVWIDPCPKKKLKVGWFTGTILLLVVYVLGVGPACLLAKNKIIPWGVVTSIYAPVDYVAKFQPAGNFIEGYIRLWTR